MSHIGHNGGPTMEPGTSWRRHCWTKARRDLLPSMPLEVINYRMKRAKELGLDFRTYAGVTATTGRDIVAFLFSSNALRLAAPSVIVPGARADRIGAMEDCGRLAAIHLPLDPRAVLDANAPLLHATDRAPTVFDSWGETRKRLLGLARELRAAPDAVLVVGETELEKAWPATARMAGYLPASRLFDGAGA